MASDDGTHSPPKQNMVWAILLQFIIPGLGNAYLEDFKSMGMIIFCWIAYPVLLANAANTSDIGSFIFALYFIGLTAITLISPVYSMNKLLKKYEQSKPENNSPSLPSEGLPAGWTMEQWEYYGHLWIAQQDSLNSEMNTHTSYEESNPIEHPEKDEITTHGMRILYICLSVILFLPLLFAGPLAIIPLGVIPFYTLVSFVKALDGLNDKQFTWGLIVPIIVLLPASLLGAGAAYQEMTDESCWGIAGYPCSDDNRDESNQEDGFSFGPWGTIIVFLLIYLIIMIHLKKWTHLIGLFYGTIFGHILLLILVFIGFFIGAFAQIFTL